MDSFFGIGLPELVLILLLAGLVMGPHRIRQVARTFGRLTAQMQRISREFARQLNSELDAIDSGDLKGSLNDMRVLQDEIEALRRELSQVPKTFREVTDSVAAEGQKAVDAGNQAISGSAPAQVEADADKEEGDSTGIETEPTEKKPSPLPRAIDVPEDPEV